MQSHTWTAASIHAHLANLSRQIEHHFSIKPSFLKEAHARGFGFRTHAALSAALNTSPVLPGRAFDAEAFVQRIAELGDETSAEAVAEIIDGAQLDIVATKYPEQRQRADRNSDIAYDVSMTLRMNDAGSATFPEVQFFLPEFGQESDYEPYSVDSAHDRRVDTAPSKTRHGAGRSTLGAKLVDGHWYGGFYVYSPIHQQDDSRAIRSLRGALARAVLPSLPTRLRCIIFKPDDYQVGAWRVEMRLPESLLQLSSDFPFGFDLPQLPKRYFVMKEGFGVGPRAGQFLAGVWRADLYSNGVTEDQNPTSIREVKRALLRAVDGILVGYR